MIGRKEFKGVGIVGTGSYVPEKVITNFDLEKMVDTTDEWIRTRTGIRERRILDIEKGSSYMAIEAAKKALEDAEIKPEDIDLIIVSTVTPDMMFPSTACLVQESLRCKNAAAFDLEAACSGFLYGLSVAYSFISSGIYKNILLIGAEALSRITDWTDRNTCVLFGDGAGAVVVSEVPEGKGVLGLDLGADGEGKDLLKISAGGSLMPATDDTIKNKLHYIYMEGNEVFKFAVRKMEEISLKVIQKTNLKLQDIDFLVPHQANMRIIESARKKLKLREDKVYINLENYGNMSSASIPVALDEAVRKNKIKNNDVILLIGFGGGLTWGAMVLKWHSRRSA
ncbi:3-oxoacyl-[acyl-carrier-protein] synthase-3 [Proteiniborus ethanoligenes]|uniref:Beta-ketoacyl-[acyl-carrier-protein] synthase III n=1 Tax=Proteiniborus ethanoligenes TaxID=415015 RepID=A0A1H3PM39_9FIRM|nr:beta-ketoacyl-ACP synthase III [Proteiniborus ethanoligenes]SDZ02078.1 3-oxoacyl-[acyl-carrier-protein] synthase-3 [Proteiniborus ethanoligenes]